MCVVRFEYYKDTSSLSLVGICYINLIMKKYILPAIAFGVFIVAGYLLYFGGEEVATPSPQPTAFENEKNTAPSDEDAEITAFTFMNDFILSAPPESDMEAAMRAYNALSTSAKEKVSEDKLAGDLALFVGVQDVPDQGVSVEDLQVEGDTATLIVGMNYSGGRVLKSVNMVVEDGVWKVDSIAPQDDI